MNYSFINTWQAAKEKEAAALTAAETDVSEAKANVGEAPQLSGIHVLRFVQGQTAYEERRQAALTLERNLGNRKNAIHGAFIHAANETVKSIAGQIPEVTATREKMDVNSAVQDAINEIDDLAGKIYRRCGRIINRIVRYEIHSKDWSEVYDIVQNAEGRIGDRIEEINDAVAKFLPNEYSSTDPRFHLIDLWDKTKGILNSPNRDLSAENFKLHSSVEDMRDNLGLAVYTSVHIKQFISDLGRLTQWTQTEHDKLVELRRHHIKSALEEALPQRPECQEIIDYVTAMPAHRLV